MLNKPRHFAPLDRTLFVVILGLLFFGLVMIYSSSSASAFRDFGDKFYYVKSQLFWSGLGIIAMLVLSLFDYHLLLKFAKLIFVGSIIFLLLVLIPGLGIQALGARRWLDIFGFNFQPAEMAKIACVLYLTSLLAKKPKLVHLVTVILIPALLIVVEPDLGTGLVLVALGFLIYFVSGARIRQFLIIGPLLLVAGIASVLISPYRRARLLTYLNYEKDPLGSSYHIRQALLALGSGGLFGVGLGQSRQKYLFLPEVSTDSIFAVIAEELGLIGGLAVLTVYLWLFNRGLTIAESSPDIEGKLLAMGLTTLIVVQAFINLAAIVALVPLTGVPLPLISYGGSSLIISLSAFGIILNISRQSTAKS